LRGIIVAVQVGAVKIYVAAVEALGKKQVFKKIYPTFDQTQVTGAGAINSRVWISPLYTWNLNHSQTIWDENEVLLRTFSGTWGGGGEKLEQPAPPP